MIGAIKNSGFRILSSHEGIEIDRIESKEEDNIVFQLRVRNITKRPIKIFSFVIAEFYIPQDIKIKRVLENNWLQCSEIKYKSIDEATVQNSLILQRDQNTYSFKEEYGYIKDSIVSEWFTVLQNSHDNLLIGAVTTTNQFSQIFIKEVENRIFIRVTSQYDGLIIKPGQVVKSEKIFFAVGNEDRIKKDFALSLAKHMQVDNIPPRIRGMCNSYYWNRNLINEEIINNELEAIQNLPEHLYLDYFQLDAGYTKYFGDWTSYKERFPNGFKDIISRIESMGYKAGIWISPFAINPGTYLHDHHKSWVLKDNFKKHFEGRWSSPFDNITNMTDLEVLDPTKDEVKDYLKSVLIHFKDLGFKLFKIDFLYPVCLSSNFSKPVTRAQALREGLEWIRQVLGNDIKILTGITQLSSVVGIADYVRTGIDTLNPFVAGIPILNEAINERMLEDNLNETELRSFLNGIVWRADPDVLVFKNTSHINNNLIKKHKNFVKENNMSMWVGDSIYDMDKETKSKLLDYFNN